MRGRSMSTSPKNTGRPYLFTLIALLLPIVLLLLVEAGLRLAGVAAVAPLFIDEPNNPDYRLTNPNVILRYFSNPTQAPGIQIETSFFLKEKPVNGLRIVVQGGSTAAGFPYGLGASPAGMLDRRLKHSFPHRQVEVINTAMSAVNSYTLLDFVDEIIEVDPDLVVVYAGHNEYLGLFGVGSRLSVAASPWITRAHLALNSLSLYRALGRLLTPAPDGAPADRDAARGLMARVAGNRSIPYESKDYQRGIEQYRHNMSQLARRYSDAGIPVFFGTVVSNESDRAPFVSAPPLSAELDGTGPADTERLREIVDTSPDSAAAWFALGRSLEDAGKRTEARAAYLQAKDRDRLRFRAPEAFNEVLKAIVADGNARLVDVQRALASASPTRIVGASLMLEHVHPTLDGYFLMADAFYDAIVESQLVDAPTLVVDDRTARQEVPVSELDKLFGDYKATQITSDWPFSDPPVQRELPIATDYAEELAQALYRQTITWSDATLKLRDYYRRRDSDEYRRLALILADAFPFMPNLQRDAAAALLPVNRAREALNYAYRAATREPNNVAALLVLAESFARMGRKQDAREVLNRALAIEPDNAGVLQAKQKLIDDIGN
jgi:tetratricopeptide (TPR) repeat protein